MILDTLLQVSLYYPVHSRFKEAFGYLSTVTPAIADGRIDIGGNGLYASVNSYTPKSKSAAVIECHRRYIDIQIVLSGIEQIGFAPLSRCTACGYDAQKDFERLEGVLDYFPLTTGMFAILFPTDGHAPGIAVDETPSMVRKLVVKIPL